MLKKINYINKKLKLIKIIYKIEKLNIKDYLIFNNKKNLKFIIKSIWKKFIKINNLLEIFCGYNKLLINYITKIYKIKKIKLSDISKNIFFIKNIVSNIKNIKLINKDKFKNIKIYKFDLLVINPPYISYKNKNLKTINLKFQPINSLTDFNKGLYFYKILKKFIFKFLNKFKYILLEINKNKLNYILNKFKNIKLLKLFNV